MKILILTLCLAVCIAPAWAQARFSEQMNLQANHFEGIASDGSHIWVNQKDAQKLLVFDAVSQQKIAEVSLNASGEALAFDGQKLLMVQSASKQILAVNRASGHAQTYIDLKSIQGSERDMYLEPLRSGEILGITCAGDRVWVACGSGYSSSIYEIDPARNLVTTHCFAPGPTPVSLIKSGNDLWVFDKDSAALRCLKESRQLVYDLSIPVGEDASLVVNMGNKAFVARKGNARMNGISLESLQALVPTKVEVKEENPYFEKNRESNARGTRKVAVLISGDTAATGFNEFWTDVVIMYRSLQKRGYNEIYVLYADGVDYKCGWDKYEEKMTDFAATKANTAKIFAALANGDSTLKIDKMAASDILFVYTFDHGASDGKLCLWKGERYSPAEMAAAVRNIAAQTKFFYMQQCFSGAFKKEFQDTSMGNLVIVTAASHTEYAYRADTEKETYNGKTFYHGEFNWHFMSALDGKTPAGQDVNADLDGNSQISVYESFKYYQKMNSLPRQTPQYYTNPEAMGAKAP